MEIIIENPEKGISNYSPLIQWAKERTSTYEGLVVQEESLSVAKADVADLRRLAKAASDYRIQIKKEHEAKISSTIEQLKELTDIFNNAASKIAVQVDAFAEREKQAKKEQIVSYWDEKIGDLKDLLSVDRVFNTKWLNKTESIDNVKKAIDEIIKETNESLDTIHGMGSKFESEMIAEYLRTLDLKSALQRKKLLEEQEARIAEMEARRASELKKMEEAQNRIPAPEPEKQEEKEPEEKVYAIDIRVYVTEAQKVQFREFLHNAGIKYCSVPKNN